MRPSFLAAQFLSATLLRLPANALDNGMALTPPMGFRTWNAYHGDIDDTLLRKVIDAMAARTRTVDGVLTSLADLGYDRVGIDDGWQACYAGWAGLSGKSEKSFHTRDGTPVLNVTKFPDLKSLVGYGHSNGLKMGWYTINCICCDTYTIQDDNDKGWAARVYAAEVRLMLDAGFDAVKIDNCGDDQGIGFQMLNDLINASGRRFLIENSDQGHTQPHRGIPTDPHGPCPGNFFRTGGDIVPDFGVILDKLNATRPYQDLVAPISRPGCWAYPDMLEVGNLAGEHAYLQSRTHFGAWCIVSAPLILSLDVTHTVTVDRVWDVISNREAISVNQAWAGHPGRLVRDGTAYQIWAKRLPGGAQAMIVINRGQDLVGSIEMPLSDLGLSSSLRYAVRDIWARRDLPSVSGGLTLRKLSGFDSAFLRLTPTREEFQV